MDTPTNPSGDVLTKAMRDAWGQGRQYGRLQAFPELAEITNAKRDAWIRQYLARMPVAVPEAPAGETPEPSPQSSPTLKTGMTVEEATLQRMHCDGIVAADWTQFTHEQSLALLTKYLPAALRTLQGEAAE